MAADIPCASRAVGLSVSHLDGCFAQVAGFSRCPSVWLAGYRHPRNAGRPGLMSAVVEAFARLRPLIEGVEAAGDPLETLPPPLGATGGAL